MRVHVTHHAQANMDLMGVSSDQVRVALLDPETTYPADPKHGPNRFFACRDSIAVVYAPDGAKLLSAITVLWRGNSTNYEPWVRGG